MEGIEDVRFSECPFLFELSRRSSIFFLLTIGAGSALGAAK
jgi:hypothetical protein